MYFIHFIGTRLPEARSGANIDENSKDIKYDEDGNFENDFMTIDDEDNGFEIRITFRIFQMDVSNYYPMKELLRDKYFDQGKLSFSLFFSRNIALHLIYFFNCLTQ